MEVSSSPKDEILHSVIFHSGLILVSGFVILVSARNDTKVIRD
jgi:hypothetical protein